MSSRQSVISKSIKTSREKNKERARKQSAAIRTKMRQSAVSAREGRLRSIEEILNVKGVIKKDTGSMIELKLSKKLINQFKDISEMTQRDFVEYVGAVRMTKMGRVGVKLHTPTRHTNGDPVRVVPPTNIANDMFVYHTHPIPAEFDNKSIVTLPSIEDFTYYLQHYPALQANVILEKRGYYIIDVSEADLRNRRFAPRRIHAKLMDMVKAGGGNSFRADWPYQNKRVFGLETQIDWWKRFINGSVDPILKSMFGVSLKYFTYDQVPSLTFLKPSSVPVPMEE